MSQLPSHLNVPENIIYELVLNSDIKAAIKILTKNKSLLELAKTPHLLNNLADVHGLPYSESLTELADYSVMDPMELLNEAAKDGDLRVALYIIDSASITDELINKALLTASGYGNLNIVNMLIEVGATSYNEALKEAAMYGYLDVVNRLIEVASDYNTALKLAARYNHLDVVSKLIDAGATDWCMALSFASERGHLDVVEKLLEIADDVSDIGDSMIWASESGYLDIVNVLIKSGASAYEDSVEYAAAEGHLDVVNMLLELSDLHIEADDGTYSRALERAVENGHLNVVNRLIEVGVKDINSRAVDDAISRGHPVIVNKLIESGFSSYDDALLKVAKHGRVDMVDMLIDAGARNYEASIDVSRNSYHNSTAEAIVDARYRKELENRQAIKGKHLMSS